MKRERANRLEIYLDNSATTKPCKEAVEACVNAMTKTYGNPSSLHDVGFAAEKCVKEAKKQIAAALKCDVSEVLFTSGATESNNLALVGAAQAKIRRGKTIVISAVEHPSVFETAHSLETQGFTVKVVSPQADGTFSAQSFADAVDNDTTLVSCMMVNNETGLLLPIAEIAAAVKAKKPDVLVHTDAVQAFLKIPIRFPALSVDLMSISGHKVYAPKGIGALIVKKGVRLVPQIIGGGQQNGLRSGTEPVPMIAAFGAAVGAQKTKLAARLFHYEALNQRLHDAFSDTEAVTFRSNDACVPYIVSLSVFGVRSETMLHFLEQKGIYVSSGSACAKGAHSHVMDALGVDRMTADETLRISFSPETTEEMIDTLVSAILEGERTLAKQRVRG